MDFVLENNCIRLVVSTTGAEVQSIVDKYTGREILWQGNAEYWQGRSPILFPACGGLWDGCYEYNGTKYEMPKHGFVRRVEWQCLRDDKSLEFVTTSNAETLAHYPFQFVLRVIYTLEGRRVICRSVVSNQMENEVLWYQLGGHPAIALPDFQSESETIGYVQPLWSSGWRADAQYLSVVRAGAQGCWSRERYHVKSDEGMVPVSAETFENEALIFDKCQISGADVLDKSKRTIVRVLSDSPVWLMWQPKGKLSPFICVEPWYGLCDMQGESVSLVDRPYSQNVLPGKCRSHLLWSIEVL